MKKQSKGSPAFQAAMKNVSRAEAMRMLLRPNVHVTEHDETRKRPNPRIDLNHATAGLK
jgi:hypothetical protein